MSDNVDLFSAVGAVSSQVEKLQEKYIHHSKRAEECIQEKFRLQAMLSDLVHLNKAKRASVQRRWDARKKLRIVEGQLKNIDGNSKLHSHHIPTPAWRLKRMRPQKIRSLIDHYAFSADSDWGASGIYFLLKGNSIVYVGQSVNVASRISQHKKNKEFDRVAYVRVSESDLDDVESAFISLLNPPLNIAGLSEIRKLADSSDSLFGHIRFGY